MLEHHKPDYRSLRHLHNFWQLARQLNLKVSILSLSLAYLKHPILNIGRCSQLQHKTTHKD